ncbi:hypothetical protein KNP414_07164 [Paenibacillus mucilaginosus KNP414]|uniref:Uncharacterized protein n=1 Tax=Paenibacillus mucilaginosus (strain KNP414) TaxID=1036673 RepID=F8FM48_PAEMK|nr:hypothetical protein KNP414_07164 [Paenibacillus mucilaginosus KNP414]
MHPAAKADVDPWSEAAQPPAVGARLIYGKYRQAAAIGAF